MLRIINSKLEFITKEIMEDAWRDAISAMRREQNITFDLENNEAVSAIRSIKKTNKDQPEYEYLAQLWCAGGDWEQPVLYFRVQIKEPSYKNRMFIFVPLPEDGNGNLKKTKNGFAAIDAEAEEGKRDEKKAWKALDKYLQDMTNKE